MKRFQLSILKAATVLWLLLQGTTGAHAQKDKVLDNIDLVFHNTADMLQQIHYAPKQLDDQFAAQIFTSYLQQLDPAKRFFLQADISRFKKQQNELDDEMRGKPVQFYKAVNAVFKQRIKEAEQLAEQLLKQPFSFNQAESYSTNTDILDWCANADALKARWKKHLKYQVLVQYDDLLDMQTKDSAGVKNNAQQEEKARQAVLRTEKRYIENLQKMATDEEAFNTYLNSIINLYDPHSNYFLPVDRRAFQENLSGIYYGIGAVLQEQQGKVLIGELMIGGPAWKSGQVEKGDVIIKVTQQGEKSGVEVAGMAMSDVIKMTRGQKESTVVITFKKQDGRLLDVTLKREPLQLDETFVKSAVIEDSVRIGYISFPRFYTDFGDPNGRSCAKDMAREVERLKKENVAGIIIDIRNNVGGSLGEAINMVGLFINGGPVVQVKNPSGAPYVANTPGTAMIYDGPLIVLVNEMSASASEIFAGAIQDYKRGIIVGGRSTYGKGSVQRSFGIGDRRMQNDPSTDLGTINITLQKYYRITGEATQLKGITPDVMLPGIYEPYDMQEKSNPTALGWDKIAPVAFTPWKEQLPFATILEWANNRIQHDTTLRALQGNLDWLRHRGEQYSLQLPVYQKEQKELQQKVLSIRSELKAGKNMAVKNNTEVENDLKKKEQFRIESNKAWLNSLQKDIYLSEAVYVIRDVLKLKNS
jgi:carboxyl-terminal processing protease